MNKITLEKLNHWITSVSENEHLEFKEAKQQFHFDKLISYCVALANEGGGHLILGVSDNSPRQIVGTKAFPNIGELKSNILQTLHIRVEIIELMHQAGRVLICEIPSRPHGQPTHYSGIDRVISNTEIYQLPAPDFRIGSHHTAVVLFAHQDFADMGRNDRIRACYLHSCLKYVSNEKMTNQSLRERFKLPENKAETVSRIISDTLEVKKIKIDDSSNLSRRYAKYIPFWA